MSDDTPITNGSNGPRDPETGRFKEGNPGGPGNPYARRSALLRALTQKAVTEDDLKAIVEAILKKAREGNIHAASFIFDRCVGKPAPAPDPDRIDVDDLILKR